MPTRKVSERERLMTYARAASDDELEQAFEILSVERRIRAGQRPQRNTATRQRTRSTATPPPNPPKPANDNPQG